MTMNLEESLNTLVAAGASQLVGGRDDPRLRGALQVVIDYLSLSNQPPIVTTEQITLLEAWMATKKGATQ
jgi:hypothetical protein